MSWLKVRLSRYGVPIYLRLGLGVLSRGNGFDRDTNLVNREIW